MTTHLIDRFLAACGLGGPLPLRVSCPGWREPVLRKLHQPFVVIGRDPRADLCLNAPEVSPCHAYLQVLAGSLFAVDLQSETGTRWPEGPARNGWLAGGQALRIGPFTVEVAEDELDEDLGTPRDWNPLLSGSAQAARLPPVTLELLNTADKQGPRRLNRLLALVGSAAGCNVRLVSSTVARFHAGLLRTAAGLWVVDLLGRSGVAVNGTPMRFALLRHGDELQVGKFQLRVGCEPARSAPAAVETTAAGRTRAASAARPENGKDPEPNGSHLKTPEPAPITTLEVPADLAAVSVPEMRLARREDALLLPLVQQFQLMQQQLFDQFQQTMLVVVKMFGTLHREQTDLVRKDLERVHALTRELERIQTDWKSQAPPTTAPAEREEKAPVRRSPAAKAARPETAAGPDAASPPQSGEPPAAPDEAIHTWLSDRMAALQQERQSQWQKIFKFLGGK